VAIARGVIQPLSLDLIDPSAARRLAYRSRVALPRTYWLLAVELGGAAPAVERATRELASLMTTSGAAEMMTLEPAQRETLTRRLRDFGRSEDDPAAAIVRISVLPSDTPAALRSLSAAGAEAIIARAGCGVVYGSWFDDPGPDLAGSVRRMRGELSGRQAQVVIEHASAAAED
jgi:hypothetical protein